jgi:hypothetical protein
MRNFALIAILALAGCASSAGSAPVTSAPAAAPPNYASITGMIATNYANLTAAAATYIANPAADATIVAKIKAIEATDGPIVAALSASSSPTTIQGVLNDLSVLATVPAIAKAVPNPSQTAADISLGLSILSTVAQTAATLAPLF